MSFKIYGLEGFVTWSSVELSNKSNYFEVHLAYANEMKKNTNGEQLRYGKQFQTQSFLLKLEGQKKY